MAKPTAQQCHALITYFVQAYNEVVGQTPVINRNTARWGFESILMDYTPAQAKELIDFYLAHDNEPRLQRFLSTYDKVVEEMQQYEKDKQSAAKRRKETEERLRLWREKKDKWAH